ncbi:hypothetical protein D3C84_927160 [compost metagenome]
MDSNLEQAVRREDSGNEGIQLSDVKGVYGLFYTGAGVARLRGGLGSSASGRNNRSAAAVSAVRRAG